MSLVESLPQMNTPADGFRHAEHPLMQRLHAVRGFLHPFEEAEVRLALGNAGGDVVVETSSADVTLYGRSEAALQHAVGRVSGYRWQHLAPGVVDVRVRDNPLRVAWMSVHVRCGRRFVALIREELARRAGRTSAAQFNDDVVMLSGHAPLSGLIGYADWVSQHTSGNGSVRYRLAQWRIAEAQPDPLSPPPGRGAVDGRLKQSGQPRLSPAAAGWFRIAKNRTNRGKG